MHHIFFCQGFSSFFKSLPHRLVRDALDDLLLDKPVGQKPQGPARAALGRLAAADRDELCLLLAVQNALARRPTSFLAVDGRLKPLLDAALADVLRTAAADLQRLGDSLVGPRRAAIACVGLEEHSRAGQFARRGLSLRDQLREFVALLIAQPYDVPLVHLRTSITGADHSAPLLGVSTAGETRLDLTGY